MGSKNKKSLELNLVLLKYSLLFLVVLGFYLFWFILNKKTLIWFESDGLYQHIPWLKKLHDMEYSLLTGKGISLWSFEIGLGADVIGNLTPVLFDPFSILIALFPVRFLSLGYTVGCILRFYFAGLSMLAYLRYHYKLHHAQIIGALSYAFCSWIVVSVQQAYFINVAILFPLIILGIDKIINDESPIVFIISVAVAFAESIYFSYMSTIMAFLYFTAVCFENRKTKSHWVRWTGSLIGKIFIYACISFLIASPSVIPTFYALINCPKSSGISSAVLPTKGQIIRWIMSFWGQNMIFGQYSFTATNSLIIVLAFLSVIRVKTREYKAPVWMFIFSVIAVLIPVWNMIMNGGSYPAGRWCYALAFFFISAAVGGIEDLKNCPVRLKTVLIGFISISAFVTVFIAVTKFSYDSFRYTIAVMALLFAIGFALLPVRNYKYLYIMLVFNIGIGWFYTYSPYTTEIKKFENSGDVNKVYNSSLLKNYKDIDDSGFYRCDYLEFVNSSMKNRSDLHTPTNEALYWNANTLSGYYSTLDERINAFNIELLNGGAGKRRTSYLSYDNRNRLNYLLSVKYSLFNSDKNPIQYDHLTGFGFTDYKQIGGTAVKSAGLTPSLGYLFSDIIYDNDFKKYSALAKEQILMQRAVVSRENGQSAGNQVDKPEIVINEVQYSISSESEIFPDDHHFSVKGDKSRLVVTLSDTSESEIYVKFEGLKKKSQGDIKYYINYGDSNSKYVFYSPGNAQAVEGVDTFLTNLGYFDYYSGNIIIEFRGSGEYSFDKLSVYSVPINSFEKQAQKLSNQSLSIVEQKNDFIRGVIDAHEDGILFLSLVYNPGWKVYIDGERQETFITDICFTGVRVSVGEHEVVLKYRPVGFNISILMFFTGIVCIIGIELYYRKRGISDLKECKAA